jgi:Sugar phosphate isomerases/epimerases
MPKLAVFPKAFMTPLCKHGTMSLAEWIEMACELDIDGLEWYAGFLEMIEEKNWTKFRRLVQGRGKTIPMLCCSPDFTHPDLKFRQAQIKQQNRWIDMADALGASYCRVLTGQYRPGLSVSDGVTFAVECIRECLFYAAKKNITLILENHYKDDFWQYPEFAQKMEIFCEVVDRIDNPFFGINFDPSNTFLAGEDPLELLRRISHRVVTMHASDRYLEEGTLQDLRREESGIAGYASRLRHGEIGKGLNDYDKIFTELRSAGFNGWISIEDGVEGMTQLQKSVSFVREKIQAHWPSGDGRLK